MACEFCEIIRHNRPAEIFHEDEDIIVFADILPRAPVHLLICPREHYSSIFVLPDDIKLKLLKTIELTAQKLNLEDNFNIQLNNGAKAGQIIEHFHFHFLSRGGIRA
jgi:histidine triad (HIT) family protein